MKPQKLKKPEKSQVSSVEITLADDAKIKIFTLGQPTETKRFVAETYAVSIKNVRVRKIAELDTFHLFQILKHPK